MLLASFQVMVFRMELEERKIPLTISNIGENGRTRTITAEAPPILLADNLEVQSWYFPGDHASISPCRNKALVITPSQSSHTGVMGKGD